MTTPGIYPNGFLDLVPSGLDANLPAAANVLSAPARTLFYYATDTNILYRWNPSTSTWDATQPKPVSVGAAATARAIAGVDYLLNLAAGSVLTLPTATGSGLNIGVNVTTTLTSAAHKVLVGNAGADKLIGNVVITFPATPVTKQFTGNVAGGFHSLQMPFAGTQPSGGFEGDWLNLQDIAAGVWLVQGMLQSGISPTTPFSTATS